MSRSSDQSGIMLVEKDWRALDVPPPETTDGVMCGMVSSIISLHSALVAKSCTTKTGGLSRSTSTCSLSGAVRLASAALLALLHSCAVFDRTCFGSGSGSGSGLGSHPRVPAVRVDQAHGRALEVHRVLELRGLGRLGRARVGEARAARQRLAHPHGARLGHRRAASGARVEQVVARRKEARRVSEGGRRPAGARVGGPVLPRQTAEGLAASVIEVTRAVAQEVLKEVGLRVCAMFGRERLVHVRYHREVGPPRLLGFVLLLKQLVNDTRRPWVPEGVTQPRGATCARTLHRGGRLVLVEVAIALRGAAKEKQHPQYLGTRRRETCTATWEERKEGRNYVDTNTCRRRKEGRKDLWRWKERGEREGKLLAKVVY